MNRLNPWNKSSLLKVAFILSFLTFGVGDGVTGAYMIEKTSVMREANPLVRFFYSSSGAQGVIALKIWFAFTLLFLVWTVSRRPNTYWIIIGFLTSFFIGGILSTISNIAAVYGFAVLSPDIIILLFLSSNAVLVIIGDFYDCKQIDKVS